MSTTRRILFLCTGNFYRSRFAEIVFNHLACQRALPWSAFSRALAIERGIYNVGPISPFTLDALSRLDIPAPRPMTGPVGVALDDLASSQKVIALKFDEHRPMMLDRWPDWVDKIDYWHVHDLDLATPEAATSLIARHVTALVDQLSAEHKT